MAVLKIVKRDEDEFERWLKKQHIKAAEKLQAWGMDPHDLLSTELGWLLCLPKLESKSLNFDHYQARFLTARARRRSILKARQVGFSFEIACESLARCHLKASHTAVCVSYNMDDAKEKIRYVKLLHDELPLEFQKKLVVDSKTEVAFVSNTSKRQISRVISHPSKAPRGKSGDVYLDELAHCQMDRDLYVGATAVIIRSGGQLTVGSTPLGQRGVFFAVHMQPGDERYPGYWRQNVPWWLCRKFCRDIEAAANPETGARTMTTQERVAAFGSIDLIDQFNMLPLEDFQQEFELQFQDERVSFFSMDLFMPCCKDRSAIPMFDTAEALAAAAERMGPLYAGYDVGRTHHPSELTIFEKTATGYVMRYEESFKNVQFPEQRARLKQIGLMLGSHLKKFRIDETGLGKNLAEDMTNELGSRRVEPINFSQQTKLELANSLKIQFEEQSIVIHNDRGLRAQIHSVKQKITSAGNAIFDVEKNRWHHGDKLWSIAMATLRKHVMKAGVQQVGVRILGAAKKPEEETTTARAVMGQGLVESLFTSPHRPIQYATPEGIKRAVAAILNGKNSREALADAPLEVLEKRMRALVVSMRVWKREGDMDSVRRYASEYQRLRRTVLARRKAGNLPESMLLMQADARHPEMVET